MQCHVYMHASWEIVYQLICFMLHILPTFQLSLNISYCIYTFNPCNGLMQSSYSVWLFEPHAPNLALAYPIT